MQPRRERPAAVEAVAARGRGQERLLRDVLGGGRVVHDEPRGAVRARPMAAEELGEGLGRAALRRATTRRVAAHPGAPVDVNRDARAAPSHRVELTPPCHGARCSHRTAPIRHPRHRSPTAPAARAAARQRSPRTSAGGLGRPRAPRHERPLSSAPAVATGVVEVELDHRGATGKHARRTPGHHSRAPPLRGPAEAACR